MGMGRYGRGGGGGEWGRGAGRDGIGRYMVYIGYVEYSTVQYMPMQACRYICTSIGTYILTGTHSTLLGVSPPAAGPAGAASQ